jgi:hypothetical protein
MYLPYHSIDQTKLLKKTKEYLIGFNNCQRLKTLVNATFSHWEVVLPKAVRTLLRLDDLLTGA